jgi:abequosyltransferase
VSPPRFSVCIPTFNRLAKLSELICSLKPECESFGNRLQIVISDNGSTDETASACLGWQQQGLNLKYVRNPFNIGPDRNFLNSVQVADGEYSLLMGDDDAVRPGLFALVDSLITQNEPDVFISDRVLCDDVLQPRGVQKCGRQLTEMQKFDFGVRWQQISYLSRVDSLIGVFSFLSTVGFRTAAWRAALDYPGSIGTAYSHVYKVMDILVRQRGCLLYIPLPTVLARLGNDSFLQALEGSIFRRWQLDFNGYGALAREMYGDDDELRRAFLSPVWAILNPETVPAYLQMAVADNRLPEARDTLALLGLS